jgi:hypothetical protein
VPQALFNYTLKGLTPDLELPPGLVVEWNMADGVSGTFRLHPNPANSMGFTGTMDPETGSVTIAQGSGCDVYDTTTSGLFGVNRFRIMAGSTIVLPAQGPPTTGVVAIDQLDGEPVHIIIMFSGTVPEVRVDYGATDEETFDTYEGFEALRASTIPRQRLACFAVDVFRFLRTQVDLVSYGLDWIGHHDEALGSGPYEDTGDSFSQSGLTPPAGIVNQGRFTARWHDTSGNGEMGPGDRFDFAMEHMWNDDTSSDEDLILDGTAALTGFTDVVNPAGETLRIGFEPYGSDPGGIFLTDWTEYFTTTNPPAVSVHTTFVINGAFSLVFDTD